jgi:hypothetical protein
MPEGSKGIRKEKEDEARTPKGAVDEVFGIGV